ncbi:MAG: AAA family ATPase [Chloroflexi bacterium]|nr:AAA family ATPase [Chloroflexota bacterium]
MTSAKAIALLAYLALTRVSHAREHLLALLWPESPGDAARKNLRNTLWSIRKVLGEDALLTTDDRLALSRSAWVDAHEFESIPQPLIPNPQPLISLYHGLLLDTLSLADAPDFEIWLTAERERFGQLYLRLLAAAIEQSRATGNWPEALELAHRALAHDNLQEPMHCALMEAHARLGQRPEALRQYDSLRAILERELGVEPLAETKALREAIARDDLPSTPQRQTKPRSAPIEPAHPPFVGRETEKVALDEELEAAASGRARLVLLTGELGIGKSRLWREWSLGLPLDCVVLEMRCLEATQTLPFAPLTELFSRGAYARRLFTPPSPVPALWLAEVARLLPDLRTALPDLPASAALPPDEERRRIFEAFTQCLLALKARPLVLFMDDLHWADRATLDWLGYLAHRLHSEALLLVATYRPEDAPPSLMQFAADRGREFIARRLPLARLTHDESETLITALVAEPTQGEAFVQRVLTQSAGNPYFLIELCRAATDGLPHSLAELVRARLHRQPDTARQVAQTAAVLEPDFDFATLRRASGRGEEETLDALDALLRAGVITEHQSRYTFAHPLVAAVVREGLSGARRVFLYRRAAQALEITYTGRLPSVAGRLAACYAQADNPPRAAHFAEMAAAHALTLAATAEAVDFYRRALAFEPTPVRELGLGRALYRKGDLAEGCTVLESAQRAFESRGDARGAAQACIALCDALLRAGHFAEVIQWGERVLAFLETEPIMAHNNAAYHAALLGDLPAAHRHIQSGLKLADERELAVTHQWLYSTRGEIALAEKQWDVAEDWFRRGRTEAERHANPEMVATYRANLGLAARGRGDLDRALTLLTEARASVPNSHQQTQIDLWLTELHLERGEPASADDVLTRAEARLASDERGRFRAWAERLREQFPKNVV